MRNKVESKRKRDKYSLRRFNPQQAMFQLYRLKDLLDAKDRVMIAQNKEEIIQLCNTNLQEVLINLRKQQSFRSDIRTQKETLKQESSTPTMKNQVPNKQDKIKFFFAQNKGRDLN